MFKRQKPETPDRKTELESQLATVRAALTDCKTRAQFARTEINRLEREGGFIGPRIRQLQGDMIETQRQAATLNNQEVALLRAINDIERARVAALPKPPVDPTAERHRRQRWISMMEEAEGRARPRYS